MTLKVEDCINKWVRFTQKEDGSPCGYVDKAFVVSSKQVYLNTEDNPRCRLDTGYIRRDEIPDWADYGWFMDDRDFGDLQLLEDIGEL